MLCLLFTVLFCSFSAILITQVNKMELRRNCNRNCPLNSFFGLLSYIAMYVFRFPFEPRLPRSNVVSSLAVDSVMLIVREDPQALGEFWEGITHRMTNELFVMEPLVQNKLPGAQGECLKKKLLVLDINGLLAEVYHRQVHKRPFYLDFLEFCFQKFEVGIWSSRSKENVERILNKLMLGDMKSKLLFCWDGSHCIETKFNSLECRYKNVMFKDLKKIWEKSDPNLPWEKGFYNESNTVLLDDSPYKALLNPPYTSVFPYSFSYMNPSDNSLAVGGDLREYLNKLADAENIPTFVKEHPFGQEAISETHPSWNFYRDILGSLSACKSESNGTANFINNVQSAH